ncbi:MAG: phage head morphogenesis protein [Ruminococcus sp.]|nr:phage head morphogenesis protein [Ruminococcus sp.]
MTEAQQLWEYQVQLRRIAEHRQQGIESNIRREYKQALQKLQAIIAKYYAAYGNSDDSTMTQGDLRSAGQYKNFLQDVVDHLNGITEPVDKQIRQVIEDTYTTCYNGMVNAVKQSTSNTQLGSLLSGLSAVTPETVKNVVENPMRKLTLSTFLNRRRTYIISSTQKTLAVGLASGDSYTRMAQRIADTLNGDYKKAMRIVRTEANRAINRGFQDVTEEASEMLLGSDYIEVKEWCSMDDESVRSTHQHLNGKKIHALDVFESSGTLADCPGAFGVASEDINCRCFLMYSIMSREEFVAQGGVIPDEVLQKEKELGLTSDGDSGIIESGSDDVSLENQRYGRNKDTLVNKTYLESGEYKRKFDNATQNTDLNKSLYQKAKEALIHRSGTVLEDMYWFDGDTGDVIAKEVDGTQERRVIYSSKTKKAVNAYEKKRLVTLHTHPSSMPPSAGDFNACFRHSYKCGFIACHDGKIFGYIAEEELNERLYNMYIESYVKSNHSEYDSQILALNDLKRNCKIDFWEVK